MKNIINDCFIITKEFNKTSKSDINNKKNNSPLNIIDAIYFVSFSLKNILINSKKNSDIQCHDGILSHLQDIFLPAKKSLSGRQDDLALDNYIQGREIMRIRDKIIQDREFRRRPLCSSLSISPKTAIIGGLILAGSAANAAVMGFRHFSDMGTAPGNRSLPDYLAYGSYHQNERDSNISEEIRYHRDINDDMQPPYLYNYDLSTTREDIMKMPISKELLTTELIDEMSSNSVYLKNKTVKRAINKKKNVINKHIMNILILDNILRITHDKSIDWQARNELYLMIKLAERSEQINRIKSSKKKNLMILVKCIQFTKEFLYEKDRYILHKEAYNHSHLIMRRLLHIVNNLNVKNKIMAWQLLINDDVIPDKLPIQKLTHNILFKEKLKKRLNNNNNFFVKNINFIEDKINLMKPALNRNDIENRQNHYYVGGKKSIKLNEKDDDYNIPDDVKKVYLNKCLDEREHLNVTDIFRIISRTMRNPVSEVIHEGLIAYNYEYLGKGCVDNESLHEISKKIEDIVNNFLSLHPTFGNLRSGIQIIAGLLDLMADDIDGKPLSSEKIATINEDLIGLFKGIISSVTSEQLSQFDEKNNRLSNMLEKIKSKNGILNIQTENPKKVVEVKEIYNHFANKKNENVLFYNSNNNWIVNDNIKLTDVIKKTFEKASEVFPHDKDIISIRNSAPDFYQDAIILNNGKELFILIDDTFKYAKEIKLNDRSYRYLTSSDTHYKKFEELTPVIYQGGLWHPEDKTSRAASNDIVECIRSHDTITNKLVSEHITHQDVSPLTLGRNIQTDQFENKYIKIDDKYFRLKIDNAASISIEGDMDTLYLTKINERYYIKEFMLDGLLAISKTELTSPISRKSDKKLFLDSSVIFAMGKHDFWDSGQVGIKMDVSIPSKLSSSKIIEGAVRLDDNDYFYYYDRLIKVTNNGDDSFTLHSAIDTEKSIIIYKNVKSNTYFNLVDKNKFNNLKAKLHCISKRQILSVCNTIHHETSNLSSLLKTNEEHAVIIDTPEETLTPSGLAAGVYKNSKNELFYYFKDKKFFHCIEAPDQQPDITPVFFTLYGKKNKDDIDLSTIISSVSVIKNFDTRELIMSTPLEAQELVFNIDSATSKILLDWQNANFHGESITIQDINRLPNKLAESSGFSDVESLIIHGGKKNLNTLKSVNQRIDYTTDMIGVDSSNNKLISIDAISQEIKSKHIEEIYDTAFRRAFSTLQNAISRVKSNSSIMYEYLINRLSITDVRARFFFIDGFKKKLHRMSLVLNENDMSNIMILTGNKNNPISETAFFTLPDHTILGYTPCDDPLDRIILNSLNIPHDYDPTIHQEQGNRQQEYFINIFSETILHESVHATGQPEDYIYIANDITGRLVPIEEALNDIETTIGSGQINESFTYLSKIYFSINPVYYKYNIDDLIRPQNLRRIYSTDNYFKTLLLLNNPDTLTIIIKDFAQLQ